MSGSPRPLVLAAHGTADAEGRWVVERCATAAAAQLGVPHSVGYVDVCAPTLEEALAGHRSPVVVPLFLASGYHVRHDVPSAVASVDDAVVTPALGVEPEVLEALADRVSAAAGDREVDGVVLTGAGSSLAIARAEVALVGRLLGERLGVATGTAYLSGPGPRPSDEVDRLRDAGAQHVVLAAHLLAPGHFLDRARDAAAVVGVAATNAIGSHPSLAALVVRRYREAVDAT